MVHESVVTNGVTAHRIDAAASASGAESEIVYSDATIACVRSDGAAVDVDMDAIAVDVVITDVRL